MRLAVAQPEVRYDDKTANLEVLLSLVGAAARRRADLVVLPECPLGGWLAPGTRDTAETVPGPYTDALAQLAREHTIAIASGVEETSEGGLFNSAVLIDPAGRLLLHHRKIDELAIGRATYGTGDRLGVCRVHDTTVGLDICADSWGDHIVATLALMGARLVLSPCAWAIEPGGEDDNVRWISERYLRLAQRHGLVFVAANSVGVVDHGPWAGRVLHGDSLVVGPGGVLAQGSRHEPDLLLVDLPAPGGADLVSP